jgi:Flp pilus assembly protein TadD
MNAKRRTRVRAMASVQVLPAADDAVEQLIARARRQRARGDHRKAVLLLREACMLDEWRARTFALLGAWLGESRKLDEAARALRHACWLRSRSGETGRARATQRVLERFAEAA